MIRACLLALLLLPSATALGQSVGALLDEADQVRTTDRATFDNLMGRLDQLEGQATPAQRSKLQLLHAYQPLLKGNYNASIAQLHRLLKQSPDDLTRFRANVMLMTNYTVQGDFSDALQSLERVLALQRRIQDPGFRQQGTLAAAILYNEVGQYALAARHAEEVLANPITQRNACFAGETNVDAKLNLGVDQSDASIDAAIQRCRSINENIPAGRLIGFLARKRMEAGDVDQAVDLLQGQMFAVEATRYTRIIGEVRAVLAEALVKQGDVLAAKAEAQKVVALKAALANTRPLASAYKVLSDIAIAQNDLQTALENYKLYSDVNKGYLTEVKTRELAYQLVHIESQQKNQQIELLNRQNSLLQLQQRIDQQKAANSRLMMLFFALFTLFVVYWAYKTKRMQMSVRRMAETDALTGICNRHHFTNQAEKTLAQCAKSGEQASLIMFDLDHFKSINDNYGHVTGDWVLKQVADTCLELCRPVDFFGRLGGEEFAILLRGCDQKAATRIADDCRMRIARIESTGSGFGFQITASFGVTSTKSANHDLDKLMTQADQMLYRAKREGRNRVKVYSLDVPFDFKDAGTRQPSPRPDPVAAPAGTSA